VAVLRSLAALPLNLTRWKGNVVSRILLLVALLFAFPAQAVVTFDWVTVGDPENVGDTEIMDRDGTTGYGAVSYEYKIGKYEVTNIQ